METVFISFLYVYSMQIFVPRPDGFQKKSMCDGRKPHASEMRKTLQGIQEIQAFGHCKVDKKPVIKESGFTVRDITKRVCWPIDHHVEIRSFCGHPIVCLCDEKLF